MKRQYAEHEIEAVAAELGQQLQSNAILALTGPLGAGKTSLVRELLVQRGVSGAITSPTFAYVNTYADRDGKTIHHFDLYRLSSADDFCEAGFEEYLDDENAFIIIEWPAVIGDLLRRGARAVRVVNGTLSYDADDLSVRQLIL